MHRLFFALLFTDSLQMVPHLLLPVLVLICGSVTDAQSITLKPLAVGTEFLAGYSYLVGWTSGNGSVS